MQYFLRFMAVLAGSVLFVASASAHHSNAAFEDRFTSVTGVVKKWEWINPHTWLTLDVVDEKGQTIEWKFEGVAPSRLRAMGINKNTFKVGDEVTIQYRPAKDGSSMGMFNRGTLPDGTTFPQQQQTPASQSSN